MQKNEIDKDLLTRYLQGRYTKEDLALLLGYLTDQTYSESLLRLMKEDWDQMNRAQGMEKSGAQYSEFMAHLSQHTGVDRGKIIRMNQPAWRAPVFRLAAAAVVACILVFTALFFVDRNAYHERDEEWVTYANKSGQQRKLYLPDSSLVYLGPASQIQTNKSFAVRNREVRLSGEAFFIVQHEGKQPFTVTTGAVTTIDIGTEFNIRYIQGADDVEVAVAKGTVDVLGRFANNDPLKIRLHHRQRLKIDPVSHTLSMDTVSAEEEIGGWRNGWLRFQEQKLQAVASELERYYGVKFHFINNESKNVRITTTLQHATIDEAIDILAITAGLNITRNGHIVYIK